jgi:hypothetical protein
MNKVIWKDKLMNYHFSLFNNKLFFIYMFNNKLDKEIYLIYVQYVQN